MYTHTYCKLICACFFVIFLEVKINCVCISSLLLTVAEQNTVENERKDLTFFRSSRLVRNDGIWQYQIRFVLWQKVNSKRLRLKFLRGGGGDWQNRREGWSFFFFFNNSPILFWQFQYSKCSSIELGNRNVIRCFIYKLWWLRSTCLLLKLQSSHVFQSDVKYQCKQVSQILTKSRQIKKLPVMQVGDSFVLSSWARSWTLFLLVMEFLAW